jgi:hypothetical protein
MNQKGIWKYAKPTKAKRFITVGSYGDLCYGRIS